MKRKMSALLILALIATMVMPFASVSATEPAYPITISTAKTEYATTEKVAVSFTGMLASAFKDGDTWDDLELRMVKGHGLTYDQLVNQNALRFDYADLTDRYSANTNQDTSVTITESGTRSFPDDGYGSGGNPIALVAGEYSLAVFNYSDSKKQVSNVVEITVGSYPVTISTTKSEFDADESIVVSYSGFLESIFKTSGSWDDVELRLVAGHNLSDADMLAKRHDYTDLADKYSNGTQQDTTVAITESGTRAFPDDGYGAGGNQIALVAGKYSLAVYNYSKKVGGYATRVSNKIEITVVDPTAPTLELSKDTYEVGEDIVATYAGFVEKYWGAVFTEIDIFKKGDVLGTDPSTAGYVIYHQTSTVDQTGLTEGTIKFPKDDMDRDGNYFPLPAGEYYMCLRADNRMIGEPVAFTVIEANKPTGDVSMFAVVALMVVCAGAVVVMVQRRKCSE